MRTDRNCGYGELVSRLISSCLAGWTKAVEVKRTLGCITLNYLAQWRRQALLPNVIKDPRRRRLRMEEFAVRTLPTSCVMVFCFGNYDTKVKLVAGRQRMA